MCKLYEIAVSAENKINIKLKKKNQSLRSSQGNKILLTGVILVKN